MVESARIARGDIISLSKLNKNKISSLVIPGGFGAAKNLSNWAFKGTEGEVLTEVKDLILHCIENKKPIGNGIITALSKDQARARCGSYDVKDHIKNGKGEEAANAVIAVLSK